MLWPDHQTSPGRCFFRDKILSDQDVCYLGILAQLGKVNHVYFGCATILVTLQFITSEAAGGGATKQRKNFHLPSRLFAPFSPVRERIRRRVEVEEYKKNIKTGMCAICEEFMI